MASYKENDLKMHTKIDTKKKKIAAICNRTLSIKSMLFFFLKEAVTKQVPVGLLNFEFYCHGPRCSLMLATTVSICPFPLSHLRHYTGRSIFSV
jgi:hypothetical protein